MQAVQEAGVVCEAMNMVDMSAFSALDRRL